jgi:hypothetical protein
MHELPGLDDLITALLHAGLRVGYCEIARLKEVFRLAPRINGDAEAARDRLRSLITSAVIRSIDDRHTLEAVLAAWLDSLDLGSWEEHRRSERGSATAPTRRPVVRPWVFGASFLIALGIIAGGVAWLSRIPIEPTQLESAPADPTRGDQPASDTTASDPRSAPQTPADQETAGQSLDEVVVNQACDDSKDGMDRMQD